MSDWVGRKGDGVRRMTYIAGSELSVTSTGTQSCCEGTHGQIQVNTTRQLPVPVGQPQGHMGIINNS